MITGVMINVIKKCKRQVHIHISLLSGYQYPKVSKQLAGSDGQILVCPDMYSGFLRIILNHTTIRTVLWSQVLTFNLTSCSSKVKIANEWTNITLLDTSPKSRLSWKFPKINASIGNIWEGGRGFIPGVWERVTLLSLNVFKEGWSKWKMNFIQNARSQIHFQGKD